MKVNLIPLLVDCPRPSPAATVHSHDCELMAFLAQGQGGQPLRTEHSLPLRVAKFQTDRIQHGAITMRTAPLRTP